MSDAPRMFIRRPQVELRTGLGRSAIYEMIGEGRFPKPVQLTSKSVAWLEDEVDAWMQARIAERDLPRDQRPKAPRKRTRLASEAHASA